MRKRPPLLVVSGIIGDAYAGEAWIGSDTVGAARIAVPLPITASLPIGWSNWLRQMS